MHYMSIDTTYQIESSSSKDTFDIGARFGKLCKGGEVFVLSSDIGGGKTTFAKGFVSGLGSEDIVTSPSFTICQKYTGRDGLRIYHFDFYRLNQAGLVAYELSEVLDEPNRVILVEWGDIIEEALPPKRILISIDRNSKSENKRIVKLNLPVGADYFMGALI